MLLSPSRLLLAAAFGWRRAGCAHNAAPEDDSTPATTAEQQVVPQTRQVSGAISYRERIALPPGSVAHVRLLDVSRADAPATVLAEQKTTLIGMSVPVPFELKVEPRMFLPQATYTVSGQIRGTDGKLLWTTDTHYPIDLSQAINDLGTLMMIKVSGRVPDDAEVIDVSTLLPLQARGNEPGWMLTIDSERMRLTRQDSSAAQLTPTPTATRQGDTIRLDAGTTHQMVVEITPALCHDSMTGMPYPYRVRVQREATELTGCGGAPEALLTKHTWKVQHIDDKAVQSDTPVTLSFTADGRMGGQGACNGFSSGYQLTGENLTTSAIAATQKACMDELMAQDQALFDVLQQLSRFDIDAQGHLLLITADGRKIVAEAL